MKIYLVVSTDESVDETITETTLSESRALEMVSIAMTHTDMKLDFVSVIDHSPRQLTKMYRLYPIIKSGRLAFDMATLPGEVER